METTELVAVTDVNPHAAREHSHVSHHIDHDSSHKQKTHKPRRRPRATMHRLNVHIPTTLFQDLEQLSNEEGRTMTEIIRLGLGLAHLATTEKKKGGTLAIIDEHGIIHKVVLS